MKWWRIWIGMDLTVHDAYTCNLGCPLLDMNPTAGTVLLSFKIANWLWWKHPCSTITDPPYRRRDSGMLLQIAIQLQYTLLLPRPKKKKKTERERERGREFALVPLSFHFPFSSTKTSQEKYVKKHHRSIV